MNVAKHARYVGAGAVVLSLLVVGCAQRPYRNGYAVQGLWAALYDTQPGLRELRGRGAG